MNDADVNAFISKIARTHCDVCNYEYEDLRQELFMEYQRIIKRKPYLDGMTRKDFDEFGYLRNSLVNKCKRLRKNKFKIAEHEVVYLDAFDSNFLDVFENTYNYIDNSVYSKLNVLDAINSLDEESRQYVVALGYLKADITFLKDAFDEVSKDCTKEEIQELKDSPTDKNISLYIMRSSPRKVKYIKDKLRSNETFLEILKKV